MADTHGVRTTEKSLRLLEELQERNGAKTKELTTALDMNKSTAHSHLATLVDRDYVYKHDNEYYLGSKLIDLGGWGMGIRLIECLKQHGNCTVRELNDHLEMSEVVIHLLLNVFVEEGYVVKEDDKYQVSLRFLDIGGAVRNDLELYRIAKPKVTELANETGELANLTTEENGEGVYLYQAQGEHGLELNTYVGCRVPLHATAFGKAILAAFPDARVEEIIERQGLPELTPNTISDRQELFDELETIQDRGIAFDDEERLDGLRCVSVPIQTEDGTVIGALSVSAPTSRLKRDQFEEKLPEKVLSAVNLIELGINYS